MPKKPDEIKKGLECCKEDECFGERENCPYTADPKLCAGVMCADALALVQQLEAQNAELLKKIEQLQAERDAAVKDLHYAVNHPLSAGTCFACAHSDDCYSGGDCDAVENDRWEWRGVQKEDGDGEV